MIRRMILPLVFGIVGTAILVALGVWQVQRLQWKEAILADIDSRVSADPVDLPQSADPEADKYLPVRATGMIGTDELHVLVSRKQVGAGYRVIVPLETEGRRVLLDRGFIPLEAKDDPRPSEQVTIIGNLHWPDETSSYTPEPDLDENIWFAREVGTMAEALETEPLMIIARDPTGQGVTPLPVTTVGIPNDHLQYAMTWFSLAAIWAGMTAYLLWRIRHRTV